MTKIARIGKVRLAVSDLERSLRFYRDVIGLRLLSAEASSATLGAPASDAVLVELEQFPGVKPLGQTTRLGLYHFAILLPSRPALGSFVAHLLTLGIQFGSADHLVSEAIYLDDPDGLGVEVYADRDRSTWRYENGQIAMATNPLQIAELLGAGDKVWRGLPTGTTIGHVHFYVNDLAKASKFYRDALGLQVSASIHPSAMFLSAGGYHHHVAVNTWAGRSPVASSEDARLISWELVLPNAAEVARIAERLGPEASDSVGIRVVLRAET